MISIQSSRIAAASVAFPPLAKASKEGLLAFGGDLSPARLVAAYRQGIFPWYSSGQPILWWSPDPRCVIFPEQFKASRSLRKSMRHRNFHFTLDTAFARVVAECAAPRESESGTWITDEMAHAYIGLHRAGFAHSAEIYQHGELVGGLYGVALGGVFFGESMFSRTTDASKVALAKLIEQLLIWDFRLIDCQVCSPHLLSLGAKTIRRTKFVTLLQSALRLPDHNGSWALDNNSD